jgi:hypothetical protein
MPFWQSTSCLVIQEFPNSLWNPKTHFLIHISPPPVHICPELQFVPHKNHFSITKPIWLMLCKEIIALLWESQETYKCTVEVDWRVSECWGYKAILITGRWGLWSCEMLRIPHCLDNRLTVNCEILATCSNTYSPVRISQEAHSVSIK